MRENIITLPAGFPVHVLTAAQCEAMADETVASLAACVDPAMRSYLKRELRGWQRLAAERS